MSTTIDQNVVEMRFDNRHFEQHVAKSMSTLEKFKQELTFSGATKGIEEVEHAVKKVDMHSLGDSIDYIRVKFSALDVIGVTALSNITNQAINAGKQLISSLSIDQITAGWSKYEKKTASVQTIMNATGLSIDEVNNYLQKLMWFSDETSYGFTDMTQALGTMAASGGDIKKLIPLITGVANATAFAGKGAAEFGQIMQYGVNQAYSLGYMQLMDWKTFESRGAGSAQLKQTFIDVAEELGKIEKGTVTIENFTKTLADKWLDTEVMEAGFGRFSEFSDNVHKLVNGDLSGFSKEIQDIYASGEIETAADAIEVLSAHYDELSVKAFKSAQEAKSFTEAIDATKDAVSSGWLKTSEIIFGDYEQAKVLWTELANTLWDVFASGAEVRNWILESALNFAKPWTEMSDKILGVVDKIHYAEDVLGHFQDVVDKVWRGDYKNSDTGRYDLLTAAGYDHRVVQTLVNKGYKYQLTIEDLAEAHEKFGLSLDTTSDQVSDMVDAFNDLSDEKLEDLGLTEDEIRLYKALRKEAKRTGKSISEIAEEMTKNDGRTMLIDSVKNIGSVILDTMQIAKDAFADIFNPPDSAEWVINIYNIIKSIKEFTESLLLVDEETGKLSETGEKLSRIFKGIFAAIDIVLTVLKGPAKIVFNTFTAILDALGTTAFDAFAILGDVVVAARDNINGVIENVTTFIADNVKAWIDELKEAEFFKTVAGWFEDAAANISTAMSDISKRISDFELTSLGSILSKVWNFLSGLGTAIANSELFGIVVDGIITAFNKLSEFFGGFKLPGWNLSNLKTWVTDWVKIEDLAAKSGVSGVGGILSGLGTHIKDNIVSWNWQVFKENLLEGFANFWITSGDIIMDGLRTCGEVFDAIKKFVFGTEEVNLPAILKVAEKFLSIYLIFKALQTVSNVVAPLDNISDALNNLATSVKWRAIGEMFKGMALALGVLTVCLVVLCGLEDRNSLVQSAMILGSLMVAMGIIVAAIGFFSSKIDGGINVLSGAGSLLLMVMAIAVLVATLKSIDTLNLEHTAETFLTLAGILATLTFGVGIISKAGGSSFRSVAAILTLMAALKMVLEIIESYDQFDWSGKTKAIERMMGMLAGLAVAIRIASGGTKAGASSTGAALLLAAMVLSLTVLLDAIEKFAETPDDVLHKGGAVVAALLGVMTLMVMAMSFANQNVPVLQKGERSANNFAGLAVALLSIVAAIWLLSTMNLEDLHRGGAAVAQILLLFTAMLGVLGMTCSNLKMGPVFVMLGLIGVLMFELEQILKRMDGMSWTNALGNASALGLLLLTIAVAMDTIRRTKTTEGDLGNWLLALLALSGVVYVLSSILVGMKDIAPESAISNAAALGILLAAMCGALRSITAIDVQQLAAKDLKTLVLAFAGMLALMYVIGIVLGEMSKMDTANGVSNAVALGVLLNAMASALWIISNSKTMDWQNMGTVLISVTVLSILLYALAGVLAVMSTINMTNGMASVTALSALLLVMSGALMIISNSKAMGWEKMGTVLISMTTLSALLYVLAGVLGMMQAMNITDGVANATALGILLTAMSGALFILGHTSYIGPDAITGMLVISGVMVVLAVVLGVMSAMNCDAVIPIAIALSTLLVAMSVVCLILGVAGTMAKPAVAGAMALVKVVAILSVLIAAIWGLMSLLSEDQVASIKDSITGFMDILSVLTEGIGKVVSGLVTGFTEGLVEAGEDLKLFAESLAGINPEVTTGTLALCEALAALTSATFWNGVNDFLFGENSLTTFGDSIAVFAVCIKDAANALKDITDDDVANITRSAEAGTALAELEACIPRKGGLWQDMMGTTDLVAFGSSIVAFADCLVAYSDKVKGDVIDADAIATSAEAGNALADLNGAVPRQNGWAQVILGERELIAFGSSIVAFADCLVEYSNIIADSTFDPEQIKASAEAGKALADLEGSIPAKNGWVQTVMGSQDIAAFGASLTAFGKGLVEYSGYAAEIKPEAIEAIAFSGKAMDEIKKVVEKVPTSGGWGEAIFGSSNGQTFGVALSTLASGISNYYKTASELYNESNLNAITYSGTVIEAIKKILEAVPSADNLAKAKNLKTAASDLSAVASVLNGITLANYDYSGVNKLRPQIRALGIISGTLDADTVSANFASLEKLATNAKNIGSELNGLNNFTYTGVDRLVDALATLGTANVQSVIDAFSGDADSIKTSVKTMVKAISDSLLGGVGNVASAAEVLANNILVPITNIRNDIKTEGKNLVRILAAGMLEKNNLITDTTTSIGDKAVAGVNKAYTKMINAGLQFTAGLVIGMTVMRTSVYNAGYALGQAAVQGEKDGQKSNSPSKLTHQAGIWLGEGLVGGMEAMGNKVYQSGKDLGANAANSMTKAVSKIADMLPDDMDIQPTIRPVIDLSEVRTGANAINDIFSGVQGVGVQSNLSAINVSMGRRLQNGSNADVVSALDKLNRKMDNIGNTTYQINGVTYDDGSNVASAIQTIAHAALRERRV